MNKDLIWETSSLGVWAWMILVVGACEVEERGFEGELHLPEWWMQEDLRIGSVDAEDQALTMIGGVLPMDDGAVWVLQPLDREIRVYDADGGLVSRLGGVGQGPGEFTFFSRAGWWRGTRDTVWVFDHSGRMNLFTSDGRFVRTVTARGLDYGERFRIDRPGMILPDGRALSLAAYQPGEQEWDGFPLVRYELGGGSPPMELAEVARTATVQVRWDGAALARSQHPMPDAPLVTFDPAGTRVIIVDRSVTPDQDDPRVRVISLSTNGDTLWDRRFGYLPEPIPRSDLDSILRHHIEGFQRFAALDGSLSEADAERAYRESVRIPDHRPPLSGAWIDRDGRIWLEWNAAPGLPGELWVLNPEGDPVARLTPPRRLNIQAIDREFLWATETDELDIPYLVRYRINTQGQS